MTDPQSLEEAIYRLRQAKKILTTWRKAGKLTSLDIDRVLDGHYNYYAGLKTGSTFAGGSSEMYVVITGAGSDHQARRVADEMIGKGNYTLHKESSFDPSKYPKGWLTQVDASTREEVRLALIV